MRKGFALLLILLVVCSVFAQEVPGNLEGGAQWYQGKPIKNIVFEGLHHIKASELEGVMAPFIGQTFNDEVFWEIHGRVYALEYFETITPSAIPADSTGSEVIIRFRVTERPTVSRITFTGNSHASRGELMNVISLKVNDVVNQAKLRMDETAVLTKYLEKGYPDIKVGSQTTPGKDGTVQVSFFITEGDKLTIDEILFEGNNIFSTRTLRGQVSLKPKGLITLFNDGAFQETKLTADIAAITQYYRDRGYIDAEVSDVVRTPKRDAKGNNILSITFRIYEGRIYTFGGVTFEGNEIFTDEQLAAVIYSKTGDTVNARRVEADIQRVIGLYAENGYIFNSIVPNETRDALDGVLRFRISIVERGRAHIEHIIVRGNEKTKEPVILREVPLEAGDVFSRTKLMDAQRNLMNLQYFSSVIPDMTPGSSESLMDLVFTVEEAPTTDIQFGLTFSGSADPDAFPISGLIKWNDRNFLGYGNIVGAGVNASPDTQSLSLEYTQRWLFGLPLSGGFDFTLRHQDRQAAMSGPAPYFNGDEDEAYPAGFHSYEEYVDNSKYPSNAYLMDYEQWGISVGFSTGYRWLTALGNLGVGGGVRTGMTMNTYDADFYRPFDPTLRDKNNQWSWTNSLWTSVSLDQRDIYYDPSKGYYLFERMGYYGLFDFEREHYVKSDTKAEYFLTLFNLPITDTYSFKGVFMLHTGVSFILPQPSYNPPVIEEANKLVVDGMFIGRGWTGERSNRGTALWENTAEIRFPIVPGILALDGFFDAAAVKATPEAFFNDFHMIDMRFSLGGGLRFAIPQFPFRFILAKRFVVEDGQVVWQKGNMGDSGLDFVISFALSSY
ncbi:outer membrane protein assembly complex, YaeT protein [Treponema primitia ZAS-2]|uniref:Outer membrane protein assembly factor BamA n=1 Tax=Treponema primitia (strain ATCC BAA-887 / DSM 12427 / ZAS-2) TaxID=545694 RepID=F5YRA0_TREPZ|nr:outer membrane protein assembly factor BamA [Treponema primitia]AEF86891.1 outer membrane protein assembly complex, YaeT protein [Treponema primitia ZAS-2]